MNLTYDSNNNSVLLYFSLEQSEMYRSKRGLPERGGRGSISARKQSTAQQMTEENMHMWTDSPWPARNHVVFGALNSFMERCNDVLELVQTTTHFKMLRLASEIGGAGGTNLNSLVEEIYAHFQEAIEKIREYNLVRRNPCKTFFPAASCQYIGLILVTVQGINKLQY